MGFDMGKYLQLPHMVKFMFKFISKTAEKFHALSESERSSCEDLKDFSILYWSFILNLFQLL